MDSYSKLFAEPPINIDDSDAGTGSTKPNIKYSSGTKSYEDYD